VGLPPHRFLSDPFCFTWMTTCVTTRATCRRSRASGRCSAVPTAAHVLTFSVITLESTTCFSRKKSKSFWGTKSVFRSLLLNILPFLISIRFHSFFIFICVPVYILTSPLSSISAPVRLCSYLTPTISCPHYFVSLSASPLPSPSRPVRGSLSKSREAGHRAVCPHN
jgi:hypothetical protein